MKAHTVFVNELGNEISAGVMVDEHSVLIYLDGPHSTVENEITLREAQVLHALLGTALYGESDGHV